MIGVADAGALVRHGTAACGGATAIGIAVVGGTRGIRAAFSGPFVLGMSIATGLLGAGATAVGPWLPVASVFGGGSGWVPLAGAGLAGVAASLLFGFRTRRG